MARSDTAIAAHHHPWLAIENLNVALFHCVTDNSGAPIAHDLHVEFHWSDLFLFCDLVHRLELDRKSTRLNSSHLVISYAVFCLKKKRHSSLARTSSKQETEVE